MKKFTKIATLTLLLLAFVVSTNAFANEVDGTRKGNREGKVNVAEKIAERTVTHEEKIVKALENQSKKLELISTYSGDYYEAYAQAFSSHNAVHNNLFDAHVAIRQTQLEVRDPDFRATMASYKASTKALAVDNEALKAEREALRETLRIAIDEEDSDGLSTALAALYDNLLEHIAFDEAKLDLLNSLFNPSI